MKTSISTIILFIIVSTFAMGQGTSGPSIKKTVIKNTSVQAKPSTNTAEPAFTTGDAGVIEALNWVRANPKEYISKVLLNPNSKGFVDSSERDDYFNSLVSDLNQVRPITTKLTYDPALYESAMCHAVTSGTRGFVGHERQDNSCKENFMAECISYGPYVPINIVCNLLIDRGVPSLGHRKILLSDRYTKVGVSIQPHASYRYNTVIDLR